MKLKITFYTLEINGWEYTEGETNKAIGYLNKFDAMLDGADFLQKHRKVQTKKKSRAISEVLFNQVYFTDRPHDDNLNNCPVCQNKIYQIHFKKVAKKKLIKSLGAYCDCLDTNDEQSKDGCNYPFVIIGGEIIRRNSTEYNSNEICHDCRIEYKEGKYHHWGCDMERCPKCGGQMIFCDCEKQVLLLCKTEEEMQHYFEEQRRIKAEKEQKRAEWKNRIGQHKSEHKAVMQGTAREEDIFCMENKQ